MMLLHRRRMMDGTTCWMEQKEESHHLFQGGRAELCGEGWTPRDANANGRRMKQTGKDRLAKRPRRLIHHVTPWRNQAVR